MKFQVGDFIFNSQFQVLKKVTEIHRLGEHYILQIYNHSIQDWVLTQFPDSILTTDLENELATPNDCYKILTGKEYKEEPKPAYQSSNQFIDSIRYAMHMSPPPKNRIPYSGNPFTASLGGLAGVGATPQVIPRDAHITLPLGCSYIYNLDTSQCMPEESTPEITCECGIHALSDGKSRPIEAHLKRCPIRLNSK